MKKTPSSKPRVDQDMAPEYRFDYNKAKRNRFAEKMNINVGWTVEKFVGEEEKEKPKALPSKRKSALKKISKSRNKTKAKKK